MSKSVLSIIFHAIYGAVPIKLTHFSCDDCENTCTLSCYHIQIGSMTHLLLLRVRSWNNGMRCMSFYILSNVNFIKKNIYTTGVSTSCCELKLTAVACTRLTFQMPPLQMKSIQLTIFCSQRVFVWISFRWSLSIRSPKWQVDSLKKGKRY